MLKSIFSISLIVIFLAGIVGINYDTHYCCGEEIAAEFSIIPHPLTCGMMGQDSDNENEGETISQVCCETDHLAFEIDNDYVKYAMHDHDIQQVDIIPMDVVLATAQLRAKPQYQDLGYSPPPLDRDIIVLIQSFLI
ncbi:MAG: hypothetical protein HRT57_07195 [Crocinitomicaceae bacterium]|nr:hypothetical protein [Crocinitomicaceae bacterium]